MSEERAPLLEIQLKNPGSPILIVDPSILFGAFPRPLLRVRLDHIILHIAERVASVKHGSSAREISSTTVVAAAAVAGASDGMTSKRFPRTTATHGGRRWWRCPSVLISRGFGNDHGRLDEGTF